MAYNFLGTFSTGQYKQLSEFVTLQGRAIELRIAYLNGEIKRIGGLAITFDTNTGLIAEISAAPSASLLGKLFSAYCLVGGFPLKELNIHNIWDPIFKPQGNESGTLEGYSNKRSDRNPYRQDALMGSYIQYMKSWILDSIGFKREDLEFKIKKLVDLSDSYFMELFNLEIVGNLTQADTDKALVSAAPSALEEWAQSKLAEVTDEGDPDPRRRQVALMPLTEMLAFITEEVGSGQFKSISQKDDDILGLTAGPVQLTFDISQDQGAEDIPIARK